MNGSITGSHRHSNDRLQAISENEFNSNGSPSQTAKNSVQAQIEKMFTDVAKDDPSINSCFAIKYLGSLPLVGKVTSLLGLQDPLRQLYLGGAGHGVSETSFELRNEILPKDIKCPTARRRNLSNGIKSNALTVN